MDAEINTLSVDWRFGIAYNTALKLCTVILYVQGYRPENAFAHYRAIMALKEIPNQNWINHSVYLNSCRMQRNTLEHDWVGTISEEEAYRLITFAKAFQGEVKAYLVEHFPDLS